MFKNKRLATAAVTVILAISIGHVMQFGLSAGPASAPGGASPRAEKAAALRPVTPREDRMHDAPKVTVAAALPRPPAEALVPVSSLRKIVRRQRIPTDSFRSPDRTAYNNLNAFGIPCETSLRAEPAPGAMVALHLAATCRPNERIEVVHEGLRFASLTSALGEFDALVPAFSVEAKFEVVLADKTRVEARTTVPEAALVDRVALQWRGNGAMSIHAFEFGADVGEPGHVYSGKPASDLQPPDMIGGEIITLGDPRIDGPLLAEVYTFPSGQVSEKGVVRLQVEAEVTPFICGKEAVAEAVQSVPGATPSIVTVRLAMPGCDAVGDILVLKNILRDLKIASN